MLEEELSSKGPVRPSDEYSTLIMSRVFGTFYEVWKPVWNSDQHKEIKRFLWVKIDSLQQTLFLKKKTWILKEKR